MRSVDQPALLVDGPKQVFSSAMNLQKCLIHAPRGSSIALIPAYPLLQLGRITMHPAMVTATEPDFAGKEPYAAHAAHCGLVLDPHASDESSEILKRRRYGHLDA